MKSEPAATAAGARNRSSSIGRLSEDARRGPRQSLSNSVRDAILDELILSGEIAPGEKMLTEAELCERYGVSRITVRSAMRSLREAGYLDVRQGIGAKVLPRAHTLASGLDQLASLDSLASTHGAGLGSVDIEIEEVLLDSDLAEKLAVPVGTPALAVRRVKLLRGVRVAWIVDYIPEGVLPFPTIREEFDGSVLDVLFAHKELEVSYADATVTAVSTGRALASRLEVGNRTPLIYLEEVTLTRAGNAVNVSQCWMLPEHFDLTLRRRRGLG